MSASEAKDEAVRATIGEHPNWTREQIAQAVGTTVQRVTEVAEELAFQRAAAAEAADVIALRTEMCEHERARNMRMGMCKECPPVGTGTM